MSSDTIVTSPEQAKLHLARNLAAYTASWYSYGKAGLPQFAADKLKFVESKVQAEVTKLVDTSAVLDTVDSQIDSAVNYGNTRVSELKDKVQDAKDRVETVRAQALNSALDARTQVEVAGLGVYDRVIALPEDVRNQITETGLRVRSARESATDSVKLHTIYGITTILDVSERAVSHLLPEGQEDESEDAVASTAATEEPTNVNLTGFAPLAPRIMLLSQTVSKRVRRRVQAKLGETPLKLRTNLDEIVHVNLMEYADTFFGSVNTATSSAVEAASQFTSDVGTAASAAKETVTKTKETVTKSVTDSLASAKEKVATPVEQTWALVRSELLHLQQLAREQNGPGMAEESKDGEKNAEGLDDSAANEHEELVLSELALALRSVVFPALISWMSNECLPYFAKLAGLTRQQVGIAVEDETKTEESSATITKSS